MAFQLYTVECKFHAFEEFLDRIKPEHSFGQMFIYQTLIYCCVTVMYGHFKTGHVHTSTLFCENYIVITPFSLNQCCLTFNKYAQFKQETTTVLNCKTFICQTLVYLKSMLADSVKCIRHFYRHCIAL